MHAGASPPRIIYAGLAMIVGFSSCGSQPPDAATLLTQSSQRMQALKGFHFQMQISGFTTADVPVQSAQGDAHPPTLHARVNLKESGFLLEVEVIFADQIYLKSFTGGWQTVPPAQVAQFFDARTLFDPSAGLFAAMRDTTSPQRGTSEKIAGHDTYPVSGTAPAPRMHQLLNPILDQGSYRATYWIENSTNDLWKARLSGNLFDPGQAATITFDFSNHDRPVSVTPPPLG
jgi:LppX_LprAFG lipoprotein